MLAIIIICISNLFGDLSKSYYLEEVKSKFPATQTAMDKILINQTIKYILFQRFQQIKCLRNQFEILANQTVMETI